MWTREMGETGEGMIAEQISVAEELVRDQVRKGCESSPRVQHSLKRPYMPNRKRDTDVQNRSLDSTGEGEGGMFRENSIEICILSRVKQNTSPGWIHETSAQAWCTGKTQRDRAEREVGGGIRMGNTCKSMADSCQCMAKTTTIL